MTAQTALSTQFVHNACAHVSAPVICFISKYIRVHVNRIAQTSLHPNLDARKSMDQRERKNTCRNPQHIFAWRSSTRASIRSWLARSCFMCHHTCIYTVSNTPISSFTRAAAAVAMAREKKVHSNLNQPRASNHTHSRRRRWSSGRDLHAEQACCACVCVHAIKVIFYLW